MKAILQASSFQRFTLGRQVLSQAVVDEYLSQAERDETLAEIDAAFDDVVKLEDLIAWSSENDLGLRKLLGLDSSRFLALSNSIAPLYPTVVNLKERLSDLPGENWYRPFGIEAAQVKQWLTGVREMTRIMNAHTATTPNLGPLVKPLPTSVTGQKTSGYDSGLSTGDILLGAGIAVGLGIFISVIS